MRLIFSEYPAEYESYRFPYQVWGVQEDDDDADDALELGFMPSRMKIGLWYLGRSLRISMKRFKENSENRRVVKNTSEFRFVIETIDQFRLSQDDFEWMFEFVKDKAGNSKYSDSAVKRIFSKYMSNLVFVWKNKKDEVVGFAPVMETEKSIYYWLGFYKSKKYVSGLGTRMMYEALQWARDNDKEFAYLGTVYTNASLYKLNFDGWEFYNGFEWSDNKEQLKFLIGRSETNDPELLKDDEFVKRFYEGDTSKVLKVEKN